MKNDINTQTSNSDFLVEFVQGRSLFDLINVKLELEDLLGRKVDVVFGEATKHISLGFREQNSEVPWRQMAWQDIKSSITIKP